MTDHWEWLLTEFAETYGIRDTYARLAHLRWIVRCRHMPARVMPAHILAVAHLTLLCHDSISQAVNGCSIQRMTRPLPLVCSLHTRSYGHYTLAS